MCIDTENILSYSMLLSEMFFCPNTGNLQTVNETMVVEGHHKH